MLKINTKASVTDAENDRERENRALARRLAADAIVLLKNENQTLPFEKGKVALYGAGVIRTIYGGSGSGEVNARYYVNILDGMTQKGFVPSNTSWLQDYEREYQAGYEAFIRNFRKQALRTRSAEGLNELFGTIYVQPVGRRIYEQDVRLSDTDQCVYVLARQSGEGKDRTLENFTISAEEQEHIRFLASHYARFVLAINSGTFMDISSIMDIPGIGAILFLSQLGEEMGNAVADVISGDVTPSGHLSDTWIKSYRDVYLGEQFSYFNQSSIDQVYEEDVFVGYRYYEKNGVQPYYAFGHGLSYTSFSIQPVPDEKVYSADLLCEQDRIELAVIVTNTGEKYAGKESVQLYLACPKGHIDKPVKQLVAFDKTALLTPGEQQHITMSFSLKDHASFDETQNCFVLEAGRYVLYIGNASDHVEEAFAFELKHEIRFRPKRKPIAPISKAASDKLSELTNEECIKLVAGVGLDVFSFKQHFTLPGYVGSTTSELAEKGVRNAILCDGPAGLRILKRSVAMKDGSIKAYDNVGSVFEYLPEWIGNLTKGKPEKGTMLYQFATAFPVGNAMAQTFDPALLEAEGDAVGREMEEYGADFWLAPGMNIHRNPLCGRNYEYYSEDPVLTGKCAAAVSRGVQKHHGRYVTLKHFCCNNQEYMRNSSNVTVSERALREIYMKVFEIAIREGGAKGIMTSYNPVNGSYNLDNEELLNGFLRGECGFDGVIMTDWFVTSSKGADPVKAMSAGNDLLMPGGKADRKALLKGLKNGSLDVAALRACAGRILNLILV